MSIVCQKCGRMFVDGDQCWADDWKVIEVLGTEATVRVETRYTCDDCYEADG